MRFTLFFFFSVIVVWRLLERERNLDQREESVKRQCEQFKRLFVFAKKKKKIAKIVMLIKTGARKRRESNCPSGVPAAVIYKQLVHSGE